jgi:AcrR family transcriptional regulator
MTEKPQKKRLRDKEKSKQQLLDAVGSLLRSKGFTALKVNDIASESGLDKKLIYKYFGSKDKLVDEYIRSLDFWSNVKKDDASIDFADGGLEFTKQMLLQQFDYTANSKEFQKILLWGLYESRKSLKRIADEREINGELLLTNITDPYFGANANIYRATTALLISGIYYLNMYAGINGNTFCGIDLTTKQGKEEIRKALGIIVDLLYKNYPK